MANIMIIMKDVLVVLCVLDDNWLHALSVRRSLRQLESPLFVTLRTTCHNHNNNNYNCNDNNDDNANWDRHYSEGCTQLVVTIEWQCLNITARMKKRCLFQNNTRKLTFSTTWTAWTVACMLCILYKKNIKNKDIEPHNNIYLGIHATVQAVLRC